MEKKINLSELWRKIKKEWRVIGIIIAVTTVVGIILTFTAPRKYQSVVQLAPEQLTSSDDESDAIFPEVYPNIVNSKNFRMALFPVEVTKADGSLTIDYRTYLVKYQRKALTEYPKAWAIAIINAMRSEVKVIADSTGKGPVRLSRQDEELLRAINSMIQCAWDKKTDAITISVVDQDPLIAATIADTVTNRLQEAITNYRTAKARLDLDYAQSICDQTYERYRTAEDEYTTYANTYQYATSEEHKLKIESLHLNTELAFNTYSEAYDKLQEAKSKLQEQTPSFTVVQSPMVAGKAYGMSRLMRVFLWLLVGCILGIAYAWWKK